MIELSYTATSHALTGMQEPPEARKWVHLHSQPFSSRLPKSGLQSCESGVILKPRYRWSGKITWPCACEKGEEPPSQKQTCADSHGHCWLKTWREGGAKRHTCRQLPELGNCRKQRNRLSSEPSGKNVVLWNLDVGFRTIMPIGLWDFC